LTKYFGRGGGKTVIRVIPGEDKTLHNPTRKRILKGDTKKANKICS